MFTTLQQQVAANLVAICRKYQQSTLACKVPVLLLLAVTLQESGWNATADNASDPNGSFGPFQLNQQAYPDTEPIAVNPWCDYGYFLIVQRWENTFSSLNGLSQWATISNRGAFIEQFAPQAQGSIAWPQGLGDTRYSEALQMFEQIS